MQAANPDLHAEARRNALKAISPTRDAAARSRQLLLTIFAEEMKYRKQDGVQEYYENLYWCAFLLYLAGHPDDVPLIWKAKHISMDTGIGLDGQCLVGAGVEATRRMLAERNESKILEYIEEMNECGELQPEELADWEAWQIRHFYDSST